MPSGKNVPQKPRCRYEQKLPHSIFQKVPALFIAYHYKQPGTKYSPAHKACPQKSGRKHQIDHPADHNRSNTQKRKNLHTLLHQSQLLFLISGEVILLFCNVNPFLF